MAASLRREAPTARHHCHLQTFGFAGIEPAPRAVGRRVRRLRRPHRALPQDARHGCRHHSLPACLLFLANARDNYHIGMEEVDDGIWSIYFHTVLLANFDERDYVIRG
jgi:hypothetical protein